MADHPSSSSYAIVRDAGGVDLFERYADIQRPWPKGKDPGQIPLPVEGVPIGVVLPRTRLPSEPACPFCDSTFQTAWGFQGHAFNVHGIRYELVEKKRSIRTPGRGLVRTLPDDRELEVLQPWMMFALAQRELYHLSWSEILSKMGKVDAKGKPLKNTAKRLQRVSQSPAAQRFIGSIHSMFSEPARLVEVMMQASAINTAADYILALEWAKEAHDYNAVEKMARHMMKLGGLKDDKAEAQGARELHITIHQDRILGEDPVTQTFEVIEASIEED